MTMELISNIAITSATNTITFSNIPQDGTDLILLIAARNTTANGDLSIRYNQQTGSYITRLAQSRVFAWSFGDFGSLLGMAASSETSANSFSSNKVQIFNYASSTKWKHANLESGSDYVGALDAEVTNRHGLFYWDATSPITRIDILSGGTNFAPGTTATLFKLTKGSTPGVTTS